MDLNAEDKKGQDGSGQPPITFDKWRETIPEDIRNDASLKDIKDLTGLAKGYVSAQKLIGSKINIPKEGDEAAWNDLYGKLGRPESPDKYQVKRPELPKEMGYDENAEKQFLPVAHKIGLNGKQVDALVAFQFEMEKTRLGTMLQQIKETEEAVKK